MCVCLCVTLMLFNEKGWEKKLNYEIWKIYLGMSTKIIFFKKIKFHPFFDPYTTLIGKKLSKNDDIVLNWGRMRGDETKFQIMKVAHHGATSFKEKMNRKYTGSKPEMDRK